MPITAVKETSKIKVVPAPAKGSAPTAIAKAEKAKPAAPPVAVKPMAKFNVCYRKTRVTVFSYETGRSVVSFTRDTAGQEELEKWIVTTSAELAANGRQADFRDEFTNTTWRSQAADLRASHPRHHSGPILDLPTPEPRVKAAVAEPPVKKSTSKPSPISLPTKGGSTKSGNPPTIDTAVTPADVKQVVDDVARRLARKDRKAANRAARSAKVDATPVAA